MSSLRQHLWRLLIVLPLLLKFVGTLSEVLLTLALCRANSRSRPVPGEAIEVA